MTAEEVKTATSQDQNDVFVSYSRKDVKRVKTIVDTLKERGYRCWMDIDGIESGDVFKRVIVRAINASKVVLFFSSASSNSSEWTVKEINIAVQLKKQIIPIRIDDAQYDESILFDLSGLDFVDCRSESPFIDRILKAVEKKCGVKADTKDVVPVLPSQGSSDAQLSTEKSFTRTHYVIWACGLCCLIAGLAFIAIRVRDVTPTSRVDTHKDNAQQVAPIDYRDLKEVADRMLMSLDEQPLNDGTYVLAIGRVKNETLQRLDTDTLTGYITEQLMKRGRFFITSAVAATADNRDELVDVAQSIKDDGKFDQTSGKSSGKLTVPTHSLFGKIIQREIRMDNGDRQIEYYFQLRITDLRTGLLWWQEKLLICKRTDRRTPAL